MNDDKSWPPQPARRFHFVGIGGVRMSALAEMLAGKGHTVTGSDRETSLFTERLSRAGIPVAIGHAAEHVGDADSVVYTPAVGEDNPEVAEARRRGIRTIEGKTLLGEMSRGKRLIAVSGTHGKTTTTAMITQICTTAGLDPTAFVGGAVRGDETNLRVGSDEIWVVEADEYDRAFLELEPSVAVVTSLEADHLDMYASEVEIVETFDAFLKRTRTGGAAIVSADYASTRALRVPVRRSRITFGLGSEADLTATDLKPEGLKTTFTVQEHGRPVGDLTIALPGRHNVSNALAAIGAARAIDLPWDAIREGLERFRGVRRRFELMGEAGGVTVINDYAHHPTEIEETLDAARSIWSGRVVAVFQPHLFTRTRDFAAAFQAALSKADACWLTDIYPARETPIPGVTGQALADGIPGCRFEGELARLAGAVLETVETGDLIVVMGAGSVERVAGEIAGRLQRGRGAGEQGGAGDSSGRGRQRHGS